MEAGINKFCSRADLDTEAAVEALFAYPLIKDLGFKDSQIQFKNSIQPIEVALGSRKVNYIPDYILSFDAKPRIVVDAKAPSENLLQWIGQAVSYCAIINRSYENENPVRYFILTNGERTLLFEWTEGKPLIDMHFSEVADVHPKYKRLKELLEPRRFAKEPKLTEAQHRFERKSIDELNAIFAWCHQHIYRMDNMSQAAGFTEFVKLVFLKLLSDRRVREEYGDLVWQERFEVPAAKVRFSTRWINERAADVPNPMDAIQFRQLTQEIERQIQRGERKRIFEKDDRIKLNPETVKSVVAKLENVFLFGIDVDLNGRLFETFLSATMRGKDLGQFFTPRSVVKLGTNLANLYVGRDRSDVVLDGCCGTGGFLIDALAHMWRQVDDNPLLSASEKAGLRRKIANECIFGVDVGQDPPLARLARMNMYLHGDGGSSIYEADFLDKEVREQPQITPEVQAEIAQFKEIVSGASDGLADVILTNPPFAKAYDPSNKRQKAILNRYDLASGEQSIRSSLMFFERYHDLMKVGGRLISVIDDGLLSGSRYKDFRDFLRQRFLIRAVVSLPGDAFQRSQARVKTSLIVLEKRDPSQTQAQGRVFMYPCRYVGIDDPNRQRTLPIDRFHRQQANEEIRAVSELFRAFLRADPSAAEWTVRPEKVANRLDVKSCFASTGRLLAHWRSQGIQVVPLGDLLEPVEASEEDIVQTELTADEVTYLVVGYDGFARAGATIEAADHRSGEELIRVRAGQIVVSHINAVNGSICVVPDYLDGCVVTKEYSIFIAKGGVDPRVVWSVMRSPEIRSEFLVRASGVGRTRVKWATIKDVLVPVPSSETAKAIVNGLAEAERQLLSAEQKRKEVRSIVDDTYGLANEIAIGTLQAFKPPR